MTWCVRGGSRFQVRRHFRYNLAYVFLAAFVAWISDLCAAPLVVPNASFESPDSPYATPIVDAWQHTPKPDWYVEDGTFLWSQLTGVFSNQPPPNLSYIDNCDGKQACWIFANQGVGLFQDYDSIGGTNTEPTHAFNETFDVGSSYRLTAGVIGGGGGMEPGATFEMGLYYRDATSNRVTVAATIITNNLTVFSNTTHFLDFAVTMPVVQPLDPWAGQHLGIHLLSTVSTNLARGYWDVDNVRLEEIQAPYLTNATWSEARFECTLVSEPGLQVDVLASTNIAVAATNWDSVISLTNETGIMQFIDPSAGLDQRFYTVRGRP